MRKFIMMVGVPGSGKTTFIDDHGLAAYAISPDTLRGCYGPARRADGTLVLSQAYDRRVWDHVRVIIEDRMRGGELIILDATNCNIKTARCMIRLAKDHRYETVLVDMMRDVTIDECIARQHGRGAKTVSADVIRGMEEHYRKLTYVHDPAAARANGITVTTPAGFDSAVYAHPTTVSTDDYDHVMVIGDIQGCHSALMETLGLDHNGSGTLDPRTLYVFAGDYLDRGAENGKVMRWLIDHAEDSNTVFVEGNHEAYMRDFAHGRNARSREFTRRTQPQLEQAGITPREVLKFTRRLTPMLWFTFAGHEYLVDHGGIADWYKNAVFVPEREYVHGTGDYDELADVVTTWEHAKPNIVQIHGHRNIAHVPVIEGANMINLERGVEDGGFLRSATIDTDGAVHPKEVRNATLTACADLTNRRFVERLLNDPANIRVRDFGDISSFNFTRHAFKKNVWNDMTQKARGLFVNMRTNQVVVRGFDKFFNEGEKERWDGYLKTVQYPISVYKKENGFLGLVGYDPSTDELIITSKGSLTGPYAEYAHDAILSLTTQDKLKAYCREHEATLLFEVCDKEHDEHIIEYPKTTTYLLDAVRNGFEFQELCDYEALTALAESLGVPVKERVTVLDDEDEARAFIADIIRDDYVYRGEHIEGFVFAGADGHMLKFKTPYYRQWKRIRALLESSKPVNRERCNELESSVLDWVAEQGIEFRSGRAWPEDEGADADVRVDDGAAEGASDVKVFDSGDLIRLRNAYQAAQGMSAGRNQ